MQFVSICYNAFMKTTKESIVNYLRKIKPELQKSGIDEIALFGSFASDSQTVYSDIDVAIRKKSSFLEKKSAYDYFDLISNLKRRIRRDLHRNSDIFDLDSDSSFAESIKKEMIYV